MKNIIVGMGFVIISCTLWAQELTQQQIDADQARQLAQQQIGVNQSGRAVRARAPLTLQQKAAMQEQEDNLLSLLMPTATSTTATARKSSLSGKPSSQIIASASDPTGLASQQFQADDQLYNGCGSDPHFWYNLPPFTNSAWLNASTPTGYSWFLDYNDWITPSNRPSLESFIGANYPLTLVNSTKFIYLTNDIDQYGDPEAHTVTFSYEYFLSSVSVDTVRCSVGYSSFLGDTGIAYTNLPPASTWRSVTIAVPAQSNFTNVCLQFTVFKGVSTSRGGPTVIIGIAQWCPIQTPLPSPSDLRAINIGTNNVMVLWNTSPYTPNNWLLLYADNLYGPWATNTVPITYTNHSAFVTFPSQYDERFYRLQHK